MPWTVVLSVLSSIPAPCEPLELEVVGVKRLRREVVEALLPGPPPVCVSDDELDEVDRRLWTLGLFSAVTVERAGRVLRVTLEEKWTLIPTLDFATSRTLVDSYGFVSLTEFNLLGHAMEVSGFAMWSERSPSFALSWREPETRARAASFQADISSIGSALVFEDSGVEWTRRWWTARVGVRPPFWYGSPWRLSGLLDVSYERSTGVVPQGLRTEGLNVGLTLAAVWDRYEWHDLVPHGTRVSLEASPFLFVTPRDVTQRHGAAVSLLTARKFEARTALLFAGAAAVSWWGDPNNAMLLGSVSQGGGVRGLPDNRYRTAAYAVGNLELRRALTLTPTLFLQPVVFLDGAVMARVDAEGMPVAAVPALSAGAGLRLVWTTLASLVPRVDGGVLFLPFRSWFVTFGLSQYL
ncbi:MAG: hypothetical protein INH41_21975 [Myxococcaceae bacterium]|nr:hypothetical protein [Myxococcaceae bacterium]